MILRSREGGHIAVTSPARMEFLSMPSGSSAGSGVQLAVNTIRFPFAASFPLCYGPV